MNTIYLRFLSIRVFFLILIIFSQTNLSFGQEIPKEARFGLDSVKISRIIVGSDNSNTIDYETVKSTITGIIDQIEITSDNKCTIEVNKNEIPASYVISGNTNAISYNNKKNVYMYNFNGNMLYLKYDHFFEKPVNGIELGYGVIMEYKILNRQ